MKIFILLISFFVLSGCASIERFIDDAYDGDPRMTEIKGDVDSLKAKLEMARDDIREKLRSRLEILREEAEMLGDLKKAEFEIKLQEIRGQLDLVRGAIDQ
jgi:hypothetical protein